MIGEMCPPPAGTGDTGEYLVRADYPSERSTNQALCCELQPTLHAGFPGCPHRDQNPYARIAEQVAEGFCVDRVEACLGCVIRNHAHPRIVALRCRLGVPYGK